MNEPTPTRRSGLLKLGLVLAGYATALLLTCAFFYVRELLMPEDPQASAGMQAFADLFLFLAMFGTLSLVPTGLALFFLRKSARFWTVFSVLSLAFAVTGLVSAVLVQPSWGAMEMFKIPRILGAPLFCLAFLISAVLMPSRPVPPPLVGTAAVTPIPRPGSVVSSAWRVFFGFPRWPFLVAAVIEAAVGAYAFLCLFVLQHWLL